MSSYIPSFAECLLTESGTMIDSYDLYWFKEGEVTSKGDGGFLNVGSSWYIPWLDGLSRFQWCYEGIIKSKQLLGKKRTVVKFGRPS